MTQRVPLMGYCLYETIPFFLVRPTCSFVISEFCQFKDILTFTGNTISLGYNLSSGEDLNYHHLLNTVLVKPVYSAHWSLHM